MHRVSLLRYLDLYLLNLFCVWGAQNNFLAKIKITFVRNVELDELITDHSTCIYPSCTVIEIFGLVTSKCVVFLLEKGAQEKVFEFRRQTCFLDVS